MTITIQQAIDKTISSVPEAPFPDTVDTVKVGDPSQELTGVVVTFLATCDIIEQAVQLGANLIITHEPTFYNHLDKTDWLSLNPGYIAKRQLIEKSRVVIWRFHDYLHSLPPDSTFMGLLNKLKAVPFITALLTSKLLPNCRLEVKENAEHFSKDALDDFIESVIAETYRSEKRENTVSSIARAKGPMDK